MRIRYNGKYVTLEDKKEWDEMLTLECSCGHALGDHEIKGLVGSDKVFEIGKCLKSGHCGQFTMMRGKFKVSKENYNYA